MQGSFRRQPKFVFSWNWIKSFNLKDSQSNMIKIEEKEKLVMITSTVSDFCDSMGYCEHKIPFHIEGVKPPPSIETLQGTIAHEKEQEIEKEQFEFAPITQEELLDMTKNVEFAREEVNTRLLYPVRTGTKNILVLLHGRTDKILRNDKTLIVQDDKFPTNLKKYEDRIEPYDDQKLQALTYLNSKFTTDGSMDPNNWFEIPHDEKIWIIKIRDKSNENKPIKIFRGIQNDVMRKFLTDSIQRFALLVLGAEERKHHNVPGKCKPCRLFSQCQYRLE